MAKRTAESFTPDQLEEIQELINDAVSKATGKSNVLVSVPDFGGGEEQQEWNDKDIVKATFTKVAESFNPNSHHKAGEEITRDWHSIKIMGKKGIVENPEFVKKYEYVNPNAQYKRS
jgi:hypothetical protein